jgi:hypothetical protein
MSNSQRHVVEALDQTAVALREARIALLATERTTRSALRRAERGVNTAQVMRARPVAQIRKPLDEALARLEQTRHNVLLAMFTKALEEGMSISELGRNYGFSRQRATRLAKEARERFAPNHTRAHLDR